MKKPDAGITPLSVRSMMSSFMGYTCLLSLLPLLGGTSFASADQNLMVPLLEAAPLVDGHTDDPAWSEAGGISTWDRAAQIEITLKAVRTDEEIFFLVSFPDSSESRQHKTLIWHKAAQRYDIGPKREDVFIFKWSMEPVPVNLTLSAEEAYKADIWYWKALRTDHAGHADDKHHFFSDRRLPKSQPIINPTGHSYYLLRSGDTGQAAYQLEIPNEFQGSEVPCIRLRTPSGSRADVKAKGLWHEGSWNIEFSRRLQTGHFDDVQFDPTQAYRFGVSRYEIAGRRPDPNLSDPAYGTGDIGEHLTLSFQ